MRESGKEDKKKIKTESGQTVGNKTRKNLYPSDKMSMSLFCFGVQLDSFATDFSYLSCFVT